VSLGVIVVWVCEGVQMYYFFLNLRRRDIQ